ncbi:MAG: glycosyltransferase, partial [Bacteroidales bacterium]|nr:glycosyltransferase [Bacteroidales bacterium]
NFGHVNEYLSGDQAGITVNPESPEEIAAALLKLLDDKKLYNHLSNNGKQAADQKYRWEFMEEKLLKIFRELVTGSSNE